MAIPSFPTTIPNIVMSEYDYKPVETKIRTEMEAGFSRVRRRSVGVPMEFHVSWKLSAAELALFEAFYEDTLYSGASWFKINLVRANVESLHTARFKEGYSVRAEAREYSWVVTATLETVDVNITSSGGNGEVTFDSIFAFGTDFNTWDSSWDSQWV